MKRFLTFFILYVSISLCQAQNLLMVVGGYPTYGHVEILNLAGQNGTCPPVHPYPFFEDTVGTFINNNSVVCGGWRSGYDTSRCFTYSSTDDTWTMTASLLEHRRYPAAVKFSDTEWFITGGYRADGVYLDSTEMWPATAFSTAMPATKYQHNLVKLNDSFALLIGGHFPDSTDIWYYNKINSIWTPSDLVLTHARGAAHAGLVTYPNGTQAVVVAGGYTEMTTEIFNIATQTWSFGPNLPLEISGGSSVQYEDTFLIVGGYNPFEGYRREILRYNVMLDDWEEMSIQMLEGREYFAAFLLPDTFC